MTARYCKLGVAGTAAGTNHAQGVHSMTVPEYKRSAVRGATGTDHASGVPYVGYSTKKVPSSCDEGTSKKGGGLLSHLV